jgi:hypothetical protein
MGDGAGGDAPRYKAFISYSHRDAKAGRWLHRRLEAYRLPRRLVGREGEHGPVPARLMPIFRDREDLPAAGDLSEKVRAALEASEHLIVVCSPDAAASPWVAKEIATFREIHPGRPVFAAIIEGEPEQCFPVPLTAEGRVEPLAADLRPGRDGRRLGVLKLVAGLAGIALDDLVQRDAQRRVRRVTYVTAAALTAVLAMAVLTAFAFSQRREAERQRAEAEGLVEFMLTDLRERLKGVGRLDVLAVVNQRALDHYRRQPLASLTPSELERRARILHAMGADDQQQKRFAQAMAEFDEAARTTGQLLADQPGDVQRIYDQAQSEFWVGYLAYSQNRDAIARLAFRRYRVLAGRLVAREPLNGQYLREVSYAEGNLCSLELKQKDIRAALARCEAALATMKRAQALLGADADLSGDLANRQAWLADAYRLRGDLSAALRLRAGERALRETRLRRDPRNVEFRAEWLWSLRATANLQGLTGQREEAEKGMVFVRDEVERLSRFDPSNKNWNEQSREIDSELVKIRATEGDAR